MPLSSTPLTRLTHSAAALHHRVSLLGGGGEVEAAAAGLRANIFPSLRSRQKSSKVKPEGNARMSFSSGVGLPVCITRAERP